MRFDQVIPFSGPVWLDASQSIPWASSTMALLSACFHARPQQVRFDLYVYAQLPPVVWLAVRN